MKRKPGRPKGSKNKNKIKYSLDYGIDTPDLFNSKELENIKYRVEELADKIRVCFVVNIIFLFYSVVYTCLILPPTK